MEALEVAKQKILQDKLPTLAAIGAALDRIEKSKSLIYLDWALDSLRALGWGLFVEYQWFAMFKRGQWRAIKAPVEVEGGEHVVGPFNRREDARIWIRSHNVILTHTGKPDQALQSVRNRLAAASNN